jgi:IS605 OrfB family transposase
MYNIALYSVRQYFFENKKYLNYNGNYNLLKEHEVYKFLGAKSAQNVMKQVDNNFNSFFKLLELKNAGKYNKKVHIPNYLEKSDFNYILIDKFTINKKGKLKIYMSKEFEDLYGKVYINVPKNLLDKEIVNIKLVPIYNCRYFEVHYTYESKENDLHLDKSKCLSIDFGINNLCTCSEDSGKSFIIDGKYLKSINQFANKKNAYLKSILDKTGQVESKRLDSLWYNRNNKVDDYLNKSASYIINYLIQNNISTLIIGYNKGFKEKVNISKRNNQNFVNLPISKLKTKLINKCEYYGIDYIVQEEAFTSKASFLDNDEIPNLDNLEHKFSGKRIKRGLYQSKDGIKFNADVNGSLNILRKSKKTDFNNFKIENIFTVKRINVLKVV